MTSAKRLRDLESKAKLVRIERANSVIHKALVLLRNPNETAETMAETLTLRELDRLLELLGIATEAIINKTLTRESGYVD